MTKQEESKNKLINNEISKIDFLITRMMNKSSTRFWVLKK